MFFGLLVLLTSRLSNLVDHVNNGQHIASKQRLDSEHVTSEKPQDNYPPVVHSLVTLDSGEKAKKFEMCYVLAWESLAFVKYPAIRVYIGNFYKTANSAKLFTLYIAEAERKLFSAAVGQNQYCQHYHGWIHKFWQS